MKQVKQYLNNCCQRIHIFATLCALLMITPRTSGVIFTFLECAMVMILRYGVDFVRNLQTRLIPAKTGFRLKKLRTYQPKCGKMVISTGRELTLSNRNSVSIVWNFLQI